MARPIAGRVPGSIFFIMQRIRKAVESLVPYAFFLILSFFVTVPAGAVDLPETAPVPEARPHHKAEKTPVPEPAPAERDGAEKDWARKDAHERKAARRPEPASAEEEKACRDNLRSLGVAFAEREPIDDEKGCAIPHPVSITTLGRDIMIEPAAELDCAMAETLADFFQDVVQPAAERHFGQGIETVGQASAFVCRPRNGTAILSEHAFGRALDIASFVLEDGTTVAVEDYGTPKQDRLDAAMFVAEVRAAACGPFKTVLGPGSNADHATHLHLDIKKRGSGYKVCE